MNKSCTTGFKAGIAMTEKQACQNWIHKTVISNDLSNRVQNVGRVVVSSKKQRLLDSLAKSWFEERKAQKGRNYKRWTKSGPPSRIRTSDLRMSVRFNYSPPLYQLSYRWWLLVCHLMHFNILLSITLLLKLSGTRY